MSRLLDRLAELGYASYQAYLTGDHWSDFRRRYLEGGMPSKCLVCGGKHVQLHHVTYMRLGREEFGDVIPLCHSHHTDVHTWLKNNGRPLDQSLLAVEELRQQVSDTTAVLESSVIASDSVQLTRELLTQVQVNGTYCAEQLKIFARLTGTDKVVGGWRQMITGSIVPLQVVMDLVRARDEYLADAVAVRVPKVKAPKVGKVKKRKKTKQELKEYSRAAGLANLLGGKTKTNKSNVNWLYQRIIAIRDLCYDPFRDAYWLHQAKDVAGLQAMHELVLRTYTQVGACPPGSHSR